MARAAQKTSPREPKDESLPKDESRRRTRVVPVLLPLPVDAVYSYAALPDENAADGAMPEAPLRPGDYVRVPFGRRTLDGVVWDGAADDVPESKLKAVRNRHDLPPMPEAHRRFIDRAARYTVTPRGAMLKMALSVPGALEPPRAETLYRLPRRGEQEGAQGGAQDGGARLTPVRRAVLTALKEHGQACSAAGIARLAGCSPGVVPAMARTGLLETVLRRDSAPCESPAAGFSDTLTDVQKEAAQTLCRAAAHPGGQGAAQGAGQATAQGEAEGARVFLLDGVTGSGKTEVYFEAIAATLAQGRQALVMLPEIALSNAFLARFSRRFGCAPGLWHSRLSAGRRRRTWRGIADGSCRVVIGARSALFLPYADLGLIVVDEEHDPAYKQEEGALYHARDMAVLRARTGNVPAVLVSATPSLETVRNVRDGRYAALHLPARFGGADFPDVSVIDMRRERPESGSFIAPPLRAAVSDALADGGQALLFLNRRGYAPLTLCRNCGHRMACPRCTAWLVEHRARGRLLCHHCGFDTPEPEQCPACGERGALTACGPGVERIYEEAQRLWPESRIMMMASDTAGDETNLRTMLAQIAEGGVDLVIGTQIIAKGHHFPGLTCVGVVDADLGLHGGDLRATERTYQLLHQVSGRAGREKRKGRVYLQTFNPENRIIEALACGDRDGFLDAEMAEREEARMPPFTRLAALIVSGRDEEQVDACARALGRCAPSGTGLETLGPAPAQFALLRGRHRRRFLVIADKTIDVQKTLRHWLSSLKIPASVKVAVDIDPQSFF